jgi:hypothetical protein
VLVAEAEAREVQMPDPKIGKHETVAAFRARIKVWVDRPPPPEVSERIRRPLNGAAAPLPITGGAQTSQGQPTVGMAQLNALPSRRRAQSQPGTAP